MNNSESKLVIIAKIADVLSLVMFIISFFGIAFQIVINIIVYIMAIISMRLDNKDYGLVAVTLNSISIILCVISILL